MLALRPSKHHALIKTMLYLHIVLYCDWELHPDGPGHEPSPLWVVYVGCALRPCLTHRPVEIPGLQSFLHSWRQVVQEQGDGPQESTELRAWARMRTPKTCVRTISLRKHYLGSSKRRKILERPFLDLGVSRVVNWLMANHTHVYWFTQLLQG